MPNARLTPFEIGSPGTNPNGKWGVEEVRDTSDTLTGVQTMDCDIAGVTIEDVAIVAAEVTIAGEVFPASTSVSFTIVAADGLTAQTGTISLLFVSTAGLSYPTYKQINLGPIEAR